MSSPGSESIGVLRELPCTKNAVLATAEQLQLLSLNKPGDFVFLDQDVKPEPKHKLGCSQNIMANLFGDRKRRVKKRPVMTLKKLEASMTQYFKNTVENVAVVESSSIYKMLALVCLANGKELEGCCHLIASHAACLRQSILYRKLKCQLRTRVLYEPMINNLNPNDLDIDHTNIKTNPKTIVSTLKELPSEWYMVQITAQHEHLKDVMHRIHPDEFMYNLKPMHSFHIITLPSGQDANNPICITLPSPSVDSTYDIRVEIETLLNNNKSDLTAVYNNNELYWKMRKKQNEKMSTAISELEFSWLREWRILLLADYVEKLDLVEDIYNMIDKLIADSSVKEITERTRWLLRKIATGACYLQPFEIERAVKYILPTQKKLCRNIVLSIVAKKKVMDPLMSAKRKTLILILDECLDHISFESIILLKHQPVTRFPSLHIAYALYKQHKSSMQNGYKIIRTSDDFGTFVVNPSLDLKKMEVRIKAFMEYWLPKWKGLYGVKPSLEFFKNALTKYSVLMYNGHGSGIQFLRGEEIEKMRVLASVLLFGCGSIKLLPVGGRLPAYGISNQYMIGCSPCILGMLWEVTDGDIDNMTAEFMSSWIPSSAKKAWSNVNQFSWNQGKIEFKGKNSKVKNEPDILIASAKSKDVCKQYMTSAAIILRGLPVKLVN